MAASTWRPAVAQNTPWLTGQLLVATDVIRDPHFYRTVVLMLRHNARGAIGVIVNRRLGDAPVAKVLEALGRN
ncbi:MAG: YqgE/AlgH family protein, partial [Nitrospirae bacterium]|nr:YqgE/AlgH family protein [Nitrospirota bacterium]